MVGKILDFFKKDECKVPLCTNQRNKKYDWPFCTECMINTVRRFLYAEDRSEYSEDNLARAEHWIKYICENWKPMVEMEEKVIKERGPDYDRDAE